MEISASEAALLVRACRKYRSTIPTYLQAARAEVELLDQLVARLIPLCAQPDDDDDDLL